MDTLNNLNQVMGLESEKPQMGEDQEVDKMGAKEDKTPTEK
jgi:hypothetical protein